MPLGFCQLLSASLGTMDGQLVNSSIATNQPAMWRIEAGRSGNAGGMVYLGTRCVALADIEDVTLEEVRDRHLHGVVIGAALFMVAALGLALFVFQLGGRERFLVGAALLALLSVAGVSEVIGAKAVRVYVMTVSLNSGERVAFTSVDRADIAALALGLTAARAARPVS